MKDGKRWKATLKSVCHVAGGGKRGMQPHHARSRDGPRKAGEVVTVELSALGHNLTRWMRCMILVDG